MYIYILYVSKVNILSKKCIHVYIFKSSCLLSLILLCFFFCYHSLFFHLLSFFFISVSFIFPLSPPFHLSSLHFLFFSFSFFILAFPGQTCSRNINLFSFSFQTDRHWLIKKNIQTNKHRGCKWDSNMGSIILWPWASDLRAFWLL